MAAPCIARGFSRHSVLFKTNAFSLLTSTRNYARGVLRVPIKVLTDEDASAIIRKPVVKEISEFQDVSEQKRAVSRRTNVKLAESTFEKVHVEPEKSKSSTKKNGFGKILKSADAEGLVLKRNMKQNNVEGSSDVNDNCGSEDKSKLEIVKDQTISERKLSSMMQKVKSVKARKASGLIFLEGERQIEDALEAGAVAEMIFFSSTNNLKSLPLTNAKKLPELYQVSYNQIQLWSDLVTSPGVIGIFHIPRQEQDFSQRSAIPLTLICDNIRDPGNMGTVLRCAASVGCKEVIVMKECVDIWDSKVLRSSCGAHFRVPIKTNIGWDVIKSYVTDDASVILADSSLEESIVHQNLGQQLLQVEDKSATSLAIEIDEETGEVTKVDSSYKNAELLRIYRQLPLANRVYCDLDLDISKQVVMVIGGETHGVSNAAHKLAHDYGGVKVHIPLENGMDSLNLGTAFGILAYEIRRKLFQPEPAPLSVQIKKM